MFGAVSFESLGMECLLRRTGAPTVGGGPGLAAWGGCLIFGDYLQEVT